MVHVELLKTLGWSDELIAEVARVADGLNSEPLAGVADAAARPSAMSAHVIFRFDQPSNESSLLVWREGSEK